jgi:hypothetical protein
VFTNLLLGYIFTGLLSLILPTTTLAMVGRSMHGATRPGPARDMAGFWPLDFQFPMADSTNMSEFTSMGTVIHHLLQMVVWLSTLQSIRPCVKDDSGGLIWLVSRLSTSWFSGGLEEPHFPITDDHSHLGYNTACTSHLQGGGPMQHFQHIDCYLVQDACDGLRSS